MELINRYIYAVTRRLPEKQREDIEKELRSLIDDMLEERKAGLEPTQEDIVAVLTDLGEPSALSAKYSGKPRYLIGPAYIDIYFLVLKIALAAASFGILVALLIGYAVSPPDSIVDVFTNVIGTVISAAIQAFAWVTVVFILIERFSPEDGPKGTELDWKPSDLPEIPSKNTVIKPSQPIVSIIFNVIFLILINFAPQLFSIYSLAEGVTMTSGTIFNLDVLRACLPLINIAFALSIAKEIFRLICGRYNVVLAAATIILGGVSTAIILIVFSNPDIWSPYFIQFLASLAAYVSITNPESLVAILGKVFFGLIIFAFLVETVETIVRTVRAGSADSKRLFSYDR